MSIKWFTFSRSPIIHQKNYLGYHNDIFYKLQLLIDVRVDTRSNH